MGSAIVGDGGGYRRLSPPPALASIDKTGDGGLPMIARGKNQQLTPDSLAATSIKGIPACELANQLAALELAYYAWLGIQVDEPTGMVVSEKWYTRWLRLILRLAKTPTEIFREEIALLARAYAAELIRGRSLASRENFYQQYCLMIERNSQLRGFLYENFRDDMLAAEVSNTPLLTVAQEIILRLRNKQPRTLEEWVELKRVEEANRLTQGQ